VYLLTVQDTDTITQPSHIPTITLQQPSKEQTQRQQTPRSKDIIITGQYLHHRLLRMLHSLSSLYLLLCLALAACVQGRNLPFKLGIRDSFMIAHSFHGHPAFGPAGGLHGATYTCDVEFSCQDIEPEVNWVIDIGKALDLLAAVLKRYNYQNLDEVFPNGEMTTTEFMCRQIFTDLKELLEAEGIQFTGEICVKLFESHKAWASYTGEV
jgi:6-pyruvoyltetrahydropterin/6-carboxytetrahydropterin synthase